MFSSRMFSSSSQEPADTHLHQLVTHNLRGLAIVGELHRDLPTLHVHGGLEEKHNMEPELAEDPRCRPVPSGTILGSEVQDIDDTHKSPNLAVPQLSHL